jgi:hypothetical protein
VHDVVCNTTYKLYTTMLDACISSNMRYMDSKFRGSMLPFQGEFEELMGNIMLIKCQYD